MLEYDVSMCLQYHDITNATSLEPQTPTSSPTHD